MASNSVFTYTCPYIRRCSVEATKSPYFDTVAYDAIIDACNDSPGRLLTVLEEAQKITPHQYLPEPVLRHIAKRLDVPLSRIYSIVTFYSFFNLKPQGDHTITVCRGTACHTRGSKMLLDDVLLRLGIKPKEGETGSFTSEDMRFTVKTVACFGQCALAPVIAIDEVIYSNVTSEKLETLLKKLASRKVKS
ncbi:MAG: NAD(P)H-dependent oxidoreductase subunit E [Spirochaetales bacterium]|nr:NAD(P)H-dependent oxidoreductase subunit E [Spirochaetales bacterium]